MKIYLIVGFLFVIGGLLFFSKHGNNGDTTRMTFSTVQADVSAGGQLIDVRTPAEYAAGHIKGAINLSLQDLRAGSVPSVAKDQKVYLYCQSGNRSGQAAAILKGAGYANITDLGAIANVQSLGGEIAN